MSATIQKLRDIARHCRYGEALPAELSAWLSQSLSRFLTHERPTTDEAFGLERARGGLPWWKEEAMRKRDKALRDLAQLVCPTLSAAAQARRIRSLAVRYASTAWLREREAEAPPPASQGTLRERLWTAFKSGAPMPIGERQLRHVLGH
ncbi:MAG TPA: hypothetical protein VEC75_06050 [Stellaceae bacterium]|nr:hypothetical protein [Stellaceae bacterium]